MPSMGSRRLAHVLLAAYVAVCLAALLAPGLFGAAERVEPMVFGLPFSFAWYAGWALTTFLVLAVYHWAIGGGRGS